jgi:anti-sigma B factor antagonist
MSVDNMTYRLRGDVDLEAAPRIVEDLRDYASRTTGAVVVDCAELSFLDSSGVDALLRIGRMLRDERRRLHLVHLSDTPRRVVDILGLGETLGVDQTG